MNLDIQCSRSAPGRLAGLLFVLGTTALPVIAANAASEAAYFDDTHEILRSGIDTEVVSGPFGYDSYMFSETADGEELALDARNASFTVANSRNQDPTDDFDCDMGALPVNRYPLKVYDPDMTSLAGGIINGEVPQEPDWEPTYCNSAAVIFKRAPSSTVDGLRITSAWDAIRADSTSPDLTVKNSWISNVRDDAVENDFFLPLVFEDNLVDGTFHGISVHSGADNISTQSKETIEVYGNVIRIREYLYKGNQKYGALFKNEDSSPTSVIHNTVVAVEYNGGITFTGYWERSWSKIEACSNNLFLWLSDQPISSAVPLPPACFTVLTGAEARAEWAQAKQNWIDCHPNVSRTPNDPVSNPEQCVANSFGGYSRNEAGVVYDEDQGSSAEIVIDESAGSNLPPTAQNDDVSLESTSVTVDVLANDSDPDGDALTLEWAGDGYNGIVTINDDDTVTYQKGGRNRKTDTFHYVVTDGRDTDTATVKVNFGSPDNKTKGKGRNK